MPGWSSLELWWYHDILLFIGVIVALLASVVAPMSYLLIKDYIRMRVG